MHDVRPTYVERGEIERESGGADHQDSRQGWITSALLGLFFVALWIGGVLGGGVLGGYIAACMS